MARRTPPSVPARRDAPAGLMTENDFKAAMLAGLGWDESTLRKAGTRLTEAMDAVGPDGKPAEWLRRQAAIDVISVFGGGARQGSSSPPVQVVVNLPDFAQPKEPKQVN